MTAKYDLGARVKMNTLTQYAGQKGTVIAQLGSGEYLIWLDDQGKHFSFHQSEFDAFVAPEVVRITTIDHLLGFKQAFNLNDDWSSPINQGITAQIRGVDFDNMGHWGTDSSDGSAGEEFHVVFKHNGDEVAMANLASLCAWATRRRG